MAIYGYIRLDSRKFHNNEQEKGQKEDEYSFTMFKRLRPINILPDPRNKDKGYHHRPNLTNLLGKLSEISDGNPPIPIALAKGDKIAVLRLSHFSDELGVQGRIISAIGAFSPQIDLIVLDNGIDTSEFTAADRRNFFAAFDSLAKLPLQPDKVNGKSKRSRKWKGPRTMGDGDGGGDGGGNGGG